MSSTGGGGPSPSPSVTDARRNVGADPSPPPAIEVRGIERRNPKTDEWLICDVSLVVDFGERLGVLGPSGAGKTVLLRAMAMLDPLDAGSIRWRGREIEGEEVPPFRRRVIYLHQRPALLDGSVEDNLRLPFTLKAHRDRRFVREEILALLGRLGRDPTFLEKSSRDLSGGEAQLLGLVRALELDPAVLLLDEPTASLDQVTTQAVETMLDEWVSAQGQRRALVWVSHDLDQARRMTTRRMYLRAGQFVQEESE